MGNELYDSKLDSINEVLFFRDALNGLQQSNGQMYQYFLGQLDAGQQ